MSRTYLYQKLVTDAQSIAAGTLGAIGLKAASVYASGIDTPEGELFIIIKFGDMQRGMAAVSRTNVTIWVYDRNKDYLRIEQILKRIRQMFESVEAQATAEGWITSIEWTGDSEDLVDDVYRASTRNSAFRVTDSGR